MKYSSLWWLLIVGLLGQALFFMRFFWQWIVSDTLREKNAIPPGFWCLSLLGSLFLLAYAVLRRDIVLVVGQSVGAAVYVRGLYLVHRERNPFQIDG